jgi:hypothetical protein
MKAPVAYEVRVRGRVGPAARAELADFAVRAEPCATVLTGALDQAALYELLARVWIFGYELIDVRRRPRSR